MEFSLRSDDRIAGGSPSDYIVNVPQNLRDVTSLRLGSAEVPITSLTVEDSDNRVLVDSGQRQDTGNKAAVVDGVTLFANQIAVLDGGTTVAIATVPPHLVEVLSGHGSGNTFRTAAPHGIDAFMNWKSTELADPALVGHGHAAASVALASTGTQTVTLGNDPAADRSLSEGAFVHSPALTNVALASLLSAQLRPAGVRINVSPDGTAEFVNERSRDMTFVSTGHDISCSVASRVGIASTRLRLRPGKTRGRTGALFASARSCSVPPGSYDPTSLATALDRCTSGARGLSATGISSSDPTPWVVRRTMGFRDTRGIERTIGIGGGMYLPEDLARGLASRMSTADGHAAYTGAYTDGRYEFATTNGASFDLLMSGNFVGSARIDEVIQILGFPKRDLCGQSSYRSTNDHTGGKIPAFQLSTGVYVDPSDATSAPLPLATSATPKVAHDWGGTVPNQRRFTLSVSGAPVIGGSDAGGHF
ncbi:MAG: hypothetical protein CL902_01105, partial [Dehalococcoidia bacterium]|nr:hypothetical protein [Dehalococcoidia bacterium]